MSEIFVPKQDAVKVDLNEYVKSVELENKLDKYSTSSQIAADYFSQVTLNKKFNFYKFYKKITINAKNSK